MRGDQILDLLLAPLGQRLVGGVGIGTRGVAAGWGKHFARLSALGLNQSQNPQNAEHGISIWVQKKQSTSAVRYEGWRSDRAGIEWLGLTNLPLDHPRESTASAVGRRELRHKIAWV